MSLHPLFKEILAHMDPCRVTAELNAHEHALNNAESQTFDVYDDDLMHDVIGNKRLAKPIQDLLVAYDQFKAAGNSFGADSDRFTKFVAPILKDLHEAVKEEWREGL